MTYCDPSRASPAYVLLRRRMQSAVLLADASPYCYHFNSSGKGGCLALEVEVHNMSLRTAATRNGGVGRIDVDPDVCPYVAPTLSAGTGSSADGEDLGTDAARPHEYVPEGSVTREQAGLRPNGMGRQNGTMAYGGVELGSWPVLEAKRT